MKCSYSSSQNHGSGKWMKMAVFERYSNYYWRYTHCSLNHDYGRKGKIIYQSHSGAFFQHFRRVVVFPLVLLALAVSQAIQVPQWSVSSSQITRFRVPRRDRKEFPRVQKKPFSEGEPGSLGILIITIY